MVVVVGSFRSRSFAWRSGRRHTFTLRSIRIRAVVRHNKFFPPFFALFQFNLAQNIILAAAAATIVVAVVVVVVIAGASPVTTRSCISSSSSSSTRAAVVLQLTPAAFRHGNAVLLQDRFERFRVCEQSIVFLVCPFIGDFDNRMTNAHKTPNAGNHQQTGGGLVNGIVEEMKCDCRI